MGAVYSTVDHFALSANRLKPQVRQLLQLKQKEHHDTSTCNFPDV